MRWNIFQLKRSQAGQTMVDLVVGLALLSSSVASAGVLSTTNSRTNAEAGRRSEAMALAQREMEGLRVLRDDTVRSSGWQALTSGATTCSNFVATRSGGTWGIGSTSGAASDGLVSYTTANSGEPQSFIDANAPFRRVVTACAATDYKQSDADSVNPIGTLNATTPSTNAYNITVTVKWVEGDGRDRAVTLRSMLTNWGEQ